MKTYIIRRIILMLPTFIGITLVVFGITQLVPGGPIDQLRTRAATMTEGGARGEQVGELSEEYLDMMRRFYGFDKPWYVQYYNWITNIFTLNLGESFKYLSPVSSIIASKIPVSAYYGLITAFLIYLICIPLGVVKAIKHKTFIDNGTSVLIFAGYAIPGFVLGSFLLVIFAAGLNWFPLGGFTSDGFDYLPSFWAKAWDVIHHSILPLICYLVGSFAATTILMKNAVIENMTSDFVKTALAKGVSYRGAIFRHALRNSLIPIATTFGNIISIFLMGSVLIETIFNIDGMGLLAFTSIVERDYPVVLGILVITSILKMVGYLLSDLCVAAVDPRVRFK